MEGQGVGMQSRKLRDGAGETEDTSWMVSINGFLMDKAYGSLFLNMMADVFVRCICAFILPLLGCSLAFGCCQRARHTKQKFSDQQIQQLRDMIKEREHTFWHDPDSNFCKFLEAAGHGLQACGTQGLANPRTDASDVSVPQATSHIPKNGYIDMAPQIAPEISSSSSSLSSSSSSRVDASASSSKLENSALISGDQSKRPVKPDVRKRPNGLIKHLEIDKEKVMKHGGIVFGGSSATLEKLSVDPQVDRASSEAGSFGHEHILDIPLLVVLPSSASLESGDELKKLLMDKLGIKFVLDKCSSRILQGSMKTTEENLRSLRELAIEGMKIDKNFTLQIDRFFMYHCTGDPEEPVLLSLRDVQMPTVLQAEYVAGVLTIRGLFLEGAEIRAATSDEYLILHPEKQEKSPHAEEIEEWRCTNLLLPAKVDKVHIFASKKVCIQGEYVTIRSEASPMVDSTLRTVMREWIPAAIVFLYVLRYVLPLMAVLLNFTLVLQVPRLWLPHLAPALVISILQLLPSSQDKGTSKEHPSTKTSKHLWLIEDHVKSIASRFMLICASFKIAPITRPAFTKRKDACTRRNSDTTSYAKEENIDSKCMGSMDKNEDSKQKPGKNSPEDLDWQWSTIKQRYSSRIADWVAEPFEPQKENNQTSEPFEVLYRSHSTRTSSHFEGQMRDYRPSNIIIKIYSKGLQQFLKSLIIRHLQVFQDYAEIQAKYVFQVYLQGALDKTKTLEIISSNQTSKIEETNMHTTQLHVFHLIRFIEKEFEETILQRQQLITQGIISWDMLWTLFQENEKVIYYCEVSKEELCGKVLSWHYKKSDSLDREKPDFVIELEVWDYNCITYESKMVKRYFPLFFQERKISTLKVRPIKLLSDVAKREEFFLERGKRYHNLVLKIERHFLQYKGIMFWSYDSNVSSDYKVIYRESIDGRVMIDQGSYAKMKPKRNMGTAHPAKGWLQGSLERDKNLPSENDPNLQFAPTIVYGFSFSLRKWGCFLIPQLHEITFSPNAFKTLVMKEDHTKTMLLALTKHYIKKQTLHSTTKAKVVTVDPLPDKGKGCIILLHGPPGTGKTLTVEALAETMECPLWQISVSTLQLKPKKLETGLVKKFEIAALWGAIMLLDEADVYLSSRKYNELFTTNGSQGNVLTGAFLRILEYYKGILFLTTNRIDSLEEAMYSRISMFVKYQEFNSEERRQLWSNFMTRVGIPNATSAFWKEVLPIQLNGRVIRNIVSNAMILCESQGEQLHEEHILDALMVFITARNMRPVDEKVEDKDGLDIVSISVPSYITHDHHSLSDVQSLLENQPLLC